jgi:hypothetical protein
VAVPPLAEGHNWLRGYVTPAMRDGLTINKALLSGGVRQLSDMTIKNKQFPLSYSSSGWVGRGRGSRGGGSSMIG